MTGNLKIRILSDLHHDNQFKFLYLPFDEDVVVLAGDIGNGLSGINWAREVIKRPVIYVPGNHEFDGHDIPQLHQQMRLTNKIPGTNVHTLINEWIMINGIQFVGTTLFPDYTYFGEKHQTECARLAQQTINDFKYQSRKNRLITPDIHYRYNLASRRFIKNALKVPAAYRILVTHYCAPHSVAAKYRSNPITAGFAVPMPNEIISQFDRWYHGHTHEFFNYKINRTRVICNPRGFDSNINGFVYDFIDEV